MKEFDIGATKIKVRSNSRVCSLASSGGCELPVDCSAVVANCSLCSAGTLVDRRSLGQNGAG